MQKLSVVIITWNEERNIRGCIRAVKSFADEILVIDSLSTDRTVTLCEEQGCRVIPHAFEGYARQKQFAADQAANDWIFVLDADEVITDELGNEIRELMHSRKIPCDGYEIHRTLFYMGRELKFSGEGNYTVLRLFNRKKGKFDNAAVHEKIEVTGRVGKLKNRMIHYSYRDLDHHLQKLNSYTTLAADEYFQQDRKFSITRAVFKFPVTFFIFYFIRLGIFDGFPGFVWSFMAAVHGTLKVTKTIEKRMAAH